MSKRMRKLIATIFAAIMIVQATSGALDVAAQELGKVRLANQYGPYANKDRNLEGAKNNYSALSSKNEVLKKEAESSTNTENYDAELEVVEERTLNSKTYEVTPGTYVKEVFFEPVHTEVDGELVDIDNTLENTSKKRSAPVYENTEGYYDVKIVDETLTMTGKEGHALSFTQQGQMTTYDVKDNTILYSEVYENIDMSYVLSGNSINTKFNINGPITQETISYVVDFGDLIVKEESEYYLFLNSENKVVFTYEKPVMFENDVIKSMDISSDIQDQQMVITITLPTEWIASSERVFPMNIQTRSAYAPVELAVDTAYVRSNTPNTSSHYFDLFVGYEDGYQAGLSYPLGVTRSYIHIGDLGLGAEKKVEGAELQLHKHTTRTTHSKEIVVSKTAGYINVGNVTWNTKPAESSLTYVSTAVLPNERGWHSFDVTSYAQDIYEGKNNVLELKCTDETPGEKKANFFYSESGLELPRLIVTYRDAWDVRPDLDINSMDMEMRLYAKKDEGFYALSFDGIAKPDSGVFFDLVKKGTNDVVITESASGNANKYFVNPIFVSNPLPNVQGYTKDNSNYTTNYILSGRILEYDVPYEYVMRVKQGDSQSVIGLRSDAIVKYKVKLGDTLRTISAYYGVPVDQIKSDNNLDSDSIQEDDVLLIRMKKDNPKVSKDVYTPPLKTIEYKAIYVNRGPRCYGSCDVIDPVQANTGNYFYESIDFALQDFEEIPFLRYYNSLGPVVSGMFGNGFTTELESYVAYDKDGNLLFFKGDGKIYKIETNGNTLTPRPTDRLEVTKENNQIQIYHMDSKETYIFDTFGSLVQIRKETGNTLNITYDNYGMITSVDLGKKKVTFVYNENNLVKEVKLPGGQSTKYTYDENRNLVSFVDAGNKKETYHFQDNRMTYLVDKNGNETAKNTYDDKGRVLEQSDANGNISELVYTQDSTTLTHSDGSEEIYEFNEYYRMTSIMQDGKEFAAYTYDANGNTTSKKDAQGNVTTYGYNGYDVTTIEYPDGTSESYQYDDNHNIVYHRDSQGIETSYTFNGSDLIGISDTKNAATTYVYDDQHRVLSETNEFGVSKSYTYDGNQVTSITHSNGLIESYVYDANGNITQESDNQGKNTTYIYNSNQQVIQKNYYDGTNEKWGYDDFGNIVEYQNRLGGLIHYTYDKNHNETKVKQGNLTSSKIYDSRNRVISETDVQGVTMHYTYDGAGNQVTETDAYGNVATNTYDEMGRAIKTIDALGNVEESIYALDILIKSISKEGLVTEYQYDEYQREIAVLHPNGTTETKTYDVLGNIATQIDSKGNETVYEYDAYGRLLQTTITDLDGETLVTTQEYDAYGNIVKSDVNGKITTTTYDIYQREVSSTNALGHTTSKQYDIEDRVIQETDANGHSTTTVYNANGDIIETTDKNGNVTKTTYDIYGTKLADEDALGYITTYVYNDRGQVIEEVDPYLHTTSYTYDEYGNTVEIQVDDTITTTNVFDDYGRQVESITLSTHTTTTYDVLGRVLQTTNELTGLSTVYTYDEFGNTIKEEDSEGLTIETTYDIYQRVVSTTDAYGRVEEKQYDVRDQIVETKHYDGTKTTSTYNVQGKMLTSIDSLGLETTYQYDELDRQIEVRAGDRVTSYVYDANGQILETTTNDRVTKSEYDANGNVLKAIDALGYITENVYNQKNQVIETIDANGNSTTQSYDAYGNVISTIDALGNETTKEYNVFGQVVKEIDALGFVEEYIFNEEYQAIAFLDKNENRTTMTYNDANQLETQTKPDGSTTSYTYDIYGREETVTEPNGKVVTNEYDVLGNVIEKIDGERKTSTTYDALGNSILVTTNDVVIEKNTYNESNQLVKQVDGNGNKTTYQYDIYGQITATNEKGYQTIQEYDVFGNVSRQIENDIVVTENIYDERQQLLQTIVNGRVTAEKQYDPVGNPIVTIEKGIQMLVEYDALARVVQISIPNGIDETIIEEYQEVTYDALGNVTNIIDGAGYSVSKTYDAYGNMTSETDGNGNCSYYEYDSVNNLIKVEDAKERVVAYTYDKNHNVIYKKVNQRLATYTYDIYDNEIAQENEYGYTSKDTYDIFGNIISHTDADGKTHTYVYDALGNKLRENDTTFTYDSRNNQLSATNDEGTVSYTYNAFNQMLESKDTKGAIVTYHYDTHLQLTQKDYAGKSVQYQYNDLGLLTSIQDKGKEIASYQYNYRNEPITTIQKQVVTNKTYDTMGRVASQKSTKDGETIYEAMYQYDGNGNITTEVVNGKENSYVYSDYDELVESNKYIGDTFVKTTYEYDIYGNQTVSNNQEGQKKYNYNDKNQVTSITNENGTIDFTYDANGNMASKSDVKGHKETYQYDDFNKLTKIDAGQFVYTYAYDANQERISATKTDTKDYHYDVWYDYVVTSNEVSKESIDTAFSNLEEQVQKKQANGGACESKLSKNKNTVDTDSYDVEYFKEPEVTKYILDRSMEYTTVLAANDTVNIYGEELVQVDDKVQVTGLNQSVVASVEGSHIKAYHYDDYGNTSDQKQGHGYNGEVKDETGLIYLRARYYDPSIARFIQIDNNYAGEKEEINTQNRYAYTLNNPYKYVDRDGNKAVGAAGAIGLAGLLESPANGYMPVQWIARSLNQTALKINYLNKSMPTKYHVDALKYWKYKSTYRVTDTRKVKLKAEVMGPPAPTPDQKKGGNGAGTDNNIIKDTGKSNNNPNKNNPTPTPTPQKPKIEICPANWSPSDWVDFLTNGFDWGTAIKEFVQLMSSGFTVNFLGTLAKGAKDSTIKGQLITISGAKRVIKDLTGLATGPKTTIAKALKTSKVSQIKSAFKGAGLALVLIEIGMDLASIVIDCILGLITLFRAVVAAVVSVVYTLIKTVASAVIKAVLVPFIGPFAWVVALVIDVGISWIEWFIDLKAKVTDFVEWILKDSVDDTVKMLQEISKKM